MTHRHVRLGPVFRLGGVGAAVLALAASSSVQDGERGHSGWCPTGEQCADETPEGLQFVGAEVSWAWQVGVAPTAVGGIQVIGLLDKVDGEPLGARFQAKATNGAAHAAAIGNGPEAVLSASAAGDGYLRISRIADDFLFDRLAIASATVSRIEVFPTLDASWPTFESRSWAVFAGGTTEVGVGLFSANNVFLVDESMALATPTESLRTGWDALRITVPVGRLGYEVAAETGSGVSATLPITVVDRIGEIRLSNGPSGVAVGDSAELCFTALSGPLTVYGAPWTFEIAGAAVAAPAAEQIHEQCIVVRVTGPGSVRITARADGLSASHEINGVKALAREAAAPPLRSSRGLGERASAAAADTADTADTVE